MGSWDEVLSGTEAALNSTGGATERMAIYTESLEGKLKTLQATWEEFVLNLQASDAFKSLIDLGTKLISVLDLLLNKIPILSNLIKAVLVVGTINVAIGTIKQLITLMGKQGLVGTLVNVGTTFTGLKSAAIEFKTGMELGFNSVTSFGAALQNFVKVTDSGETALGKLALSFGSTAKAAGLAGVGIGQVVVALAPLAVAAAAVVGIGLAVWFNSAKKAAKDAEEAVKSFNDQQQKIDETQSELDTINDKIAEINAKDGITLTDKQELQNLREQREELETLLATYKQLQETAAPETAKAVRKSIDKSYQTTKGGIFGFGSVEANTGVATNYAASDVASLREAYAGYKISGDLDDAVGLYKRYTELQEDAKRNGKELDEQSQKYYGELASNLKDHLTDLQNQKTQLESLGDTESEQYLRVVSLLDMIEQATSPEAWRGHKLTELLLGDDASQAVQDAVSQIDEIKQQFADGIIDEDTYREKILSALQTIANDPDIQEGLKNIFPDLDLSDQNATLNTIAGTLDVTIPGAAEKAGEYIKQAFDNSIESVDHMSEVTDEFANKLSGIDLSTIKGLNEAIDGSTDIMNDADAALQAYQDDIDSMQSGYDSLVSSMNGMSNAMDFVASNMDVLSGSTTISAAEFQKLVDTASGISWINAETGETVTLFDALGISLNEDGTVAVNANGGIQGFIGQLQTNADATTVAMNNIVTAINQVRAALGAAATTAANWAKNVSGTLSKFNVFGIANGAIKTLDNFAVKATGIASSMEKSIKESTAASKKQIQGLSDKFNAGAANAQKAYDKVGSAAKKSGGSGKKATKDQTDATKELTDALKEEYEAQKAILDAQKKQLQARKEALAQEKSDLADAKNAIQDLIDMTMKMLKQEYQNRVDIIEKQIDALQDDLSNQQDKLEKAYNKQTEALENQLDAFNEKIEAQKEYLKLQKEEQDHADELSEKNQAIADVQAQLEELRYDNSASAQKKRLELLDELNGAQKDLTDYQNQYDYDTKVDGLDKEQSAFQQQIEDEKNALKDRYDQEKQQIEDTYNAKIDALNKEKDYIKNTLMDETNLYHEAIALIESRSDSLYQRLIEWNRQYGTRIDADVTQAWRDAYKALDEYGYLGNGVQEILEGITVRTDEIVQENKLVEASIKSIENQLDALKQAYLLIILPLRKLMLLMLVMLVLQKQLVNQQEVLVFLAVLQKLAIIKRWQSSTKVLTMSRKLTLG